MKNISKALIFIVIISAGLFILMPDNVIAAGLVPCGEEGNACELCDILALVKNVIDYIMYPLMPVVATMFILYAGLRILISGGNSGARSSALGMLKNVLIGVAIMSAAWLITTFVLKTLTGTESWFIIECSGPAGGALPPSGVPNSEGGGRLTEQSARSTLSRNGIGVKRQCAPGESVGCVRLAGVRQEVLDEVVRMKRECDCEVFVTSATEGQHAEGTYSHGNGFKIDLRSNDNGNSNQLTNYILNSGNFRKVADRSDGVVYAPNNSSKIEYFFEHPGDYTLEDGDGVEHWDVLVLP